MGPLLTRRRVCSRKCDCVLVVGVGDDGVPSRPAAAVVDPLAVGVGRGLQSGLLRRRVVAPLAPAKPSEAWLGPDRMDTSKSPPWGGAEADLEQPEQYR